MFRFVFSLCLIGFVICFSAQAQMITKGPPVTSGKSDKKEKKENKEKKEKIDVVADKKTTEVKTSSAARPYQPTVATVYFEPISKPVFGSFSGVSKVVAGADHIVALKEDGTTWAWGYSQLDKYGSVKGLSSFLPVQILSKYKWKRIALSDHNFYGIRDDGSLWAMGKSNAGQLGIGIATNTDQEFPLAQIGKDVAWESIQIGRDFVIALKKDGTLWSWGTNEYGQLGNGKYGGSVNAPVQVNTENQWSMISAGYMHTLALKKDGTLWSWGANETGALGINRGNIFTPVHVQVGDDQDWTYISTHNNSCFAIKRDGSLWVWGENLKNNLGLGVDQYNKRTAPVRLDNNIKWTKVHSRGEEVIALDENGRAWVWGFSRGNKIGNTPQLVSTEILFKDVYIGGSCFFGIRTDGSLWVWTHDKSTTNRCIGIADETPAKLGKEPKRITQSLIGF